MDWTSRAINIFVKVIGKTWTFIISDVSGNSPYSHFPPSGRIFCTWHENILPFSYYFRNSKASFLASYSKDGRRLTSILQDWGGHAIKGSSRHRGLSAVRECVKTLKMGNNLVITPDGPRGPRRVVKKGISQIALLSRVPVVAVSISCKSSWRLRSWDTFLIPKPFATIVITMRNPVMVVSKKNGGSVVRLTEKIQKELEHNE